jgi:hypothetical protein
MLRQVCGFLILSQPNKSIAEIGHSAQRVVMLRPKHALSPRQCLPSHVCGRLVLSQLIKAGAEVAHHT